MKIHGEIAEDAPGVADNVHHSNAWHRSIDLQLGVKSYPTSCLVGGAITILKNMSSSMGRMTSHILWKNKICVPNHQSVVNLMVYNLAHTY